MIKLRNTCYVLVLCLLCCKRPYNPPPTSTSNSFLVVEGVINLSADSTDIKLSRTVKINDRTVLKPVLGATVAVEAEKFPVQTQLTDYNNNGHYFSYGLNIPANQRYRLRILTAEGITYLSDFVEPKLTPPIDSIGYSIKNNILNLYVNAHDVTNKTRYYRWEYEETWRFHAKYASAWVLDASINAIVPRNENQQVFNCFGNDISSHIVLTSTEKLAKDVVYQSPLTQIPLSSEKVEDRYSILVRQYAVTQDAFNFYQNLEKNSEQLGSIFDAQPSQITGNIHCVTNPNEPVIGYVTVSTIQTKRVFISHTDLPGFVPPAYPYDCEEDTAYYSQPKTMVNQVQNTLINQPIYIPTRAIYSGPIIVGFLYSTVECADCTIRGVKQPPPWWIP